jgi:hypothetical protein
MLRNWIPIGAGLLAAVAAAVWFWTAGSPGAVIPAPAPAVSAPGGSVEARVAALEKELAAERDARLALETEAEMLRLLLEDYTDGRFDKPPATVEAAPSASAPGAAPEAGGENPQAAVQAAPGVPAPGERLWFDAPALARASLPDHEVERLRRLFEESELEVLQLRDRANREGWAGTPRFLEELRATRAGLRSEVGDETFDWLLYATQRPNRVVVRSLLSTGAAAQAGVREGDMILRYDDRNIFRGGELQSATMQGKAGRPVAMVVKSRDGEERRVVVPSGPLGIQLGQAIVAPESGG